MDITQRLLNLHHSDWLLREKNQLLLEAIDEINPLLESLNSSNANVIIAEADPLRFLAIFLSAHTRQLPIFLTNPHWGTQEWEQAWQVIGSGCLFSDGKVQWIGKDALETQRPEIMVPTGGSSGRIRFAIHTWETLAASVAATRTYFEVDRIHSHGVLPLYHVSGLMQFMRCFLSQGNLRIQAWKDLESRRECDWDPSGYFLSLVPTQLQRLIHQPEITTWLTQFRAILLGGSSAWSELLEQARSLHLPLAPTYGMTETASQIVTLKPDDFLKGNRSSGQVLPHAKIEINQSGKILIQASSLALGYYPDYWQTGSGFETQDLGFLDSDGYLIILGRADEVVITGGEKVQILEVEQAILNLGLVSDICVVSMADPEWGQVLGAAYVPRIQSENLATQIITLLKSQLSSHKIPKHWLELKQLPRNAQGKLNRQAIQQILKQSYPPNSTD